MNRLGKLAVLALSPVLLGAAEQLHSRRGAGGARICDFVFEAILG